jgi:hypothetical protein
MTRWNDLLGVPPALAPVAARVVRKFTDAMPGRGTENRSPEERTARRLAAVQRHKARLLKAGLSAGQ